MMKGVLREFGDCVCALVCVRVYLCVLVHTCECECVCVRAFRRAARMSRCVGDSLRTCTHPSLTRSTPILALPHKHLARIGMTVTLLVHWGTPVANTAASRVFLRLSS